MPWDEHFTVQWYIGNFVSSSYVLWFIFVELLSASPSGFKEGAVNELIAFITGKQKQKTNALVYLLLSRDPINSNTGSEGKTNKEAHTKVEIEP